MTLAVCRCVGMARQTTTIQCLVETPHRQWSTLQCLVETPHHHGQWSTCLLNFEICPSGRISDDVMLIFAVDTAASNLEEP